MRSVPTPCVPPMTITVVRFAPEVLTPVTLTALLFTVLMFDTAPAASIGEVVFMPQ